MQRAGPESGGRAPEAPLGLLRGGRGGHDRSGWAEPRERWVVRLRAVRGPFKARPGRARRRGPFKAWPTWQPLEPPTRSEAGRRALPVEAAAGAGADGRNAERASERAKPPAAAMGQNDLMGTAEDFADQVRPAGSAASPPRGPSRRALPLDPLSRSPPPPPGPRAQAAAIAGPRLPEPRRATL